MSNLQPIEYKNQRIVTTEQLATAYGTESQLITNNFNRNRDRYTEGKHYYCLEGELLREFRSTNQIDLSIKTNKFYLWTEKGAWLHAKSLNTDKAWEAYEKLVDDYFSLSQTQSQYKLPATFSECLRMLADSVEENQILAPKAQSFDKFLSGRNSQPVGEVAKALGTGRTKLFSLLRDQKILMRNNTPYQNYLERGYFEVIERPVVMGGETINKPQTLVTAKGVDYIGKLMARCEIDG